MTTIGPALAHPLTFRVMRLIPPRPSLRPNLPFSVLSSESSLSSSTDEPSRTPSLPTPPPWEAEGAICGLGQTTVFPSTFGSIYAGETFRALVTLANVSTSSKDQTLSVVEPVFHIQDPTTGTPVAIGTTGVENDEHKRIPTADVLDKGDHIARVVEVHCEKVGVHVLVCTTTYNTSSATSNERRTSIGDSSQRGTVSTVRQSFRFNVLPSMAVNVTVRDFKRRGAIGQGGKGRREGKRWLVEACAKNLMQVPVVWWDGGIEIEKGRNTAVRLLGGGSNEGIEDSSEGRAAQNYGRLFTNSGDTRGFLFEVIEEQRDIENAGGTADASRVLGTLRIAWRSAHGEVGRLTHAATVYTPVDKKRPIDLRIVSVPSVIRAQHQFAARCLATNNTTRTVRLRLDVLRNISAEILPVGVNEQDLGELVPGAETECSIVLLALSSGKHLIAGVRVIDLDTEKVYDAEPPFIRVV